MKIKGNMEKLRRKRRKNKLRDSKPGMMEKKEIANRKMEDVRREK